MKAHIADGLPVSKSESGCYPQHEEIGTIDIMSTRRASVVSLLLRRKLARGFSHGTVSYELLPTNGTV
jgi:hypothetical protein